MHVDLRVRGERGIVPAGIDLSAFRIVQEALTNVVKHAATPGCRVTIDYRDGELSLEVVDDGRAGRSPGRRRPGDVVSGHGLIGMRERVHLCGGQFSAGPRPERGFRVAATLPLNRADGVSLASSSPTTRPWCEWASAASSTPRPASRWSARPANGEEAIEVARRARPDVILMDVRMPLMDGIEATRQITAAPETCHIRTLILTTFDLDEYVYAALRAGASGFLLKDTLPADLLARDPGRRRRRRAARAERHPTADRRVRAPARPRTRPDQPATGRCQPLAGSPNARSRCWPWSPGAVQRRDRRPPARSRRHRQDPRRPPAGQARRPRPRPAGDPRLPERLVSRHLTKILAEPIS